MTSPNPNNSAQAGNTSGSSHAPHRSGLGTRRRNIALVLLLGVGGILGGVGILSGLIQNPLPHLTLPTANASQHEKHNADSPKLEPQMVKVIKPKTDGLAGVVVERIATVEPYYRADLRARASGLIKSVLHDIGDEVKKGEVLLEIDVSESEQDVEQKQALIKQREIELKVSAAKHQNAVAAMRVTAATIKQRQAEVQATTATRDLKKRKFDRYRDLADRGSVTGNIVEEEERDYLASEAALLAGNASVERAKADHEESSSKLAAAAADIELKQSQIETARTELERAIVVANYGKVIAPFDGVVVRRNVDPGSFVQNATTGNSEILISIARNDIVTVVSSIPDNAAPYIRVGTQATVQFNDFSGASISSKVTRFSPSIQNSDRTMRIEIDMFNGNEDEHTIKFAASPDGKASSVMLKGPRSFVPEPAFLGTNPTSQRIVPGMNASVTLTLGTGNQGVGVPSTAVFSRSGAKYILVVSEGKTRQLPVKLHLNDGNVARLSIVSKDHTDGGRESLADLSGEELVVITNQLQVGDSTEVRTTVVDW